jgi:hypothetical protein
VSGIFPPRGSRSGFKPELLRAILHNVLFDALFLMKVARASTWLASAYASAITGQNIYGKLSGCNNCGLICKLFVAIYLHIYHNNINALVTLGLSVDLLFVLWSFWRCVGTQIRCHAVDGGISSIGGGAVGFDDYLSYSESECSKGGGVL